MKENPKTDKFIEVCCLSDVFCSFRSDKSLGLLGWVRLRRVVLRDPMIRIICSRISGGAMKGSATYGVEFIGIIRNQMPGNVRERNIKNEFPNL